MKRLLPGGAPAGRDDSRGLPGEQAAPGPPPPGGRTNAYLTQPDGPALRLTGAFEPGS